ncbi:MAG: hypothetical protein AB1592_13825 [Pseudomonadota bacterium]
MEPMYNPSYNPPYHRLRGEVTPECNAGVTERDVHWRGMEVDDRPLSRAADASPGDPPIPPAFAPGALDLLRERVARMRATLPPTPPAPLPPASAPDEGEHAPSLRDELASIRATLTRLGGQSQAGQLESAVEALGRKIDLLNAKALDPVAMRRLEIQTVELRAAVDRALRLQAVSDTRAEAVIVPFTQYAGAVRDATEATLLGQERVEREMEDLRERLHGLSDRIGALPEEFSEALGEQVDMLLDRIDRPGMDASALAPLVDVIERHLIALTERVMASQQRLDRLEGIEQALHRICDQMDEFQAASADVSAEAIQAVAMRLSAREDAPAMIGLKRGLAALEARQREFEARTEDFLTRDVDFVRAAEAELQGLADMELVRPPRQRDPLDGGAAEFAPFHVDLDRPVFDGALGDVHGAGARAARADWLAAVERTEGRPAAAVPAHKSGARRLLFFASRAAVLVAAVGLAGVTVLQIARPAASYARATPVPPVAGGAVLAGTPAAAAPVKAPDAASLPMPPVSEALRTAALGTDAQAAYELGLRYADGRGVETNTEAAMKWLAVAVARGSVPAAYRLGTLYEYSARNALEARRLYAWAAERGHVRAMHNLGVLATEGVDGQADWAGAVAWFRKAAQLGLADSQHNLGVIYARGLAGETDLVEAFKWFAVAAAQGDTSSARKRDEVARRTDAASLTRAQALAAAFVPGIADPKANTVAAKPEWTQAAPAQAGAPAAPGTPPAAVPAAAPVPTAAATPSAPVGPAPASGPLAARSQPAAAQPIAFQPPPPVKPAQSSGT